MAVNVSTMAPDIFANANPVLREKIARKMSDRALFKSLAKTTQYAFTNSLLITLANAKRVLRERIAKRMCDHAQFQLLVKTAESVRMTD